MIFRRALAVAALVVFASSCVEQAPRERGDERRAAIINGDVSGEEQDGVVLLRALLDESDMLCTATLVGPNLLLTARHCVSYFTDGFFSCSVRGELTDNPDGAGQLGLHLPPGNIEVYGADIPRKLLARGKQVVSTLSPAICINDLAFVVLDRDVDLPLVPLRLASPTTIHEAVTLVGYGLDGQQLKLDYRSAPRRQKLGLQVAALGPDSIADGVETVPPRALILEGPSGCIGDSGGPLLAAESGAVLGVYSLQQAEDCNDPAVRHQLVHVPPFRNLIDEAFAAAGVKPIPEPSPEPHGGSPAVTDAGPEPDASSTAGAGGAPGPDAPDSRSSPPPSSCAVAVAPRVGGKHEFALLLALLTSLARRRARRAFGAS